MRLSMLQLLPLFFSEQRGSNFPADVVAIFTRRGDLETLLQKGLLHVRVEHGVGRFDGIDIGGSEKSRNCVGEKVILDPGFAVWVGNEVVANVRAPGLSRFGCGVNGEKTDCPALVLEDIERRGWLAIGFLNIKKVWSSHRLFDSAFEVGTVDPESRV